MKNWRLWAAVAVSVLLFAGAFALAYVWWLADPTLPPQIIRTITVERRELTAVVKAAGAVAEPDPVALSFPVSGRVAAVHITEGQQVRQGQLLAELETDELLLAVEAAEAALAVAQARLAQAQQGPRAAELSAAQAALAAAESRYREAAAGPLRAEIAAAEADLRSAQVAYDQLIAGPNPDQLRVLSADLERAKVNLRQAQANYDRFAWREGFGASPQAAALEQATIEYERALGAYNLATAPPTEDKIERAKANIVEAQARLERLRAGGGAAVEAAAAEVARAQAEIDRLNALPDARAIAVAQAQVQQAEVAVKQARERLSATRLTAPHDGLVMAEKVAVGEIVAAGAPAIELIDLAHQEVIAYVHETHIAQVRPGQQVSLHFPALPDMTLSGQISRVSPLSVSKSPAAYEVTVQLPDPSLLLRPGMTADVEIITAQKVALVLPRNALRLDRGGWSAQVLRDGQAVLTPVTVGMAQGREVEILTGLAEGEQVLLSTFPVYTLPQATEGE